MFQLLPQPVHLRKAHFVACPVTSHLQLLSCLLLIVFFVVLSVMGLNMFPVTPLFLILYHFGFFLNEWFIRTVESFVGARGGIIYLSTAAE